MQYEITMKAIRTMRDECLYVADVEADSLEEAKELARNEIDLDMPVHEGMLDADYSDLELHEYKEEDEEEDE